MKKISFMFLLAAGLLAIACPSLNASGLTLQECVANAIANSPDLSSQRHLVNAYRADITKKTSTTLPYLSSQIQTYEVNGTPVTPWSTADVFEPENGAGRRNAHWAPIGIESIGVTYPIINEGSFFGLNDPPVVSAARAQAEQQGLLESLSEQKLIFKVVSDFIYTNSYRQQLVTLDRILDLVKTELSIVEEQVRLGRKLPQNAQAIVGERIALESARDATRENANNFAIDLSNVVEADQNDDRQPIQIDSTLPELVQTPPLRSFLDQMVPSHPALQVEATKVEIARQQLRVDEANRWPTANFATSFSGGQDLDYFSGNSSHPRPTAFQSYLTVSIPVFDFGGRQAAVRESRENLLAQRDHSKQAELDIRSSITEVFGEILEEVAMTARLRSELERDREKLALKKEQMNEGDEDQLDVLQTEDATLQDILSIEVAEMSQRLKYAALQNLSAGKWHWAP